MELPSYALPQFLLHAAAHHGILAITNTEAFVIPHATTSRLPNSFPPSRAVSACLLLPLLASLGACAVLMPGDNFEGELPLLTPAQQSLSQRLREDVHQLAGIIGERNLAHPAQLKAAENYLAASLARAGYQVHWQTYTAVTPHSTPIDPALANQHHEVSNLWVDLPGLLRPDEVILVGAHYDSVNNFHTVASPGANDNASGVAAVLQLARDMAGEHPDRTIRFAFFTCEEPPYFWTEQMGSLVFARQARRLNHSIIAMLSIETIGRYSQEPGSQSYPPLVDLAYPDIGNFIAFVGMSSAEDLVKRCVGTFRATTSFPAEGAALPTLIPRVGSSDHWSFWKQGYPALMITDTAPYRSTDYHKASDTPEKLDYESMARVVEGLRAVITDLAQAP